MPTYEELMQPQDSGIGGMIANKGEDVYKALRYGLTALPLGLYQAIGSNFGIPALEQAANDVAAKELGRYREAVDRSPVVGTVAGILPQALQLAPAGIIGGGVTGGLLTPQLTQEQMQAGNPNQASGETVFTRTLSPVIETIAKVPEFAGIDPNSRLGMGITGGITSLAAAAATKGAGIAANKATQGAAQASKYVARKVVNPEAVKLLNDLNIKPTIAGTTDIGTVRLADRSLANMPGSAGVMDADSLAISNQFSQAVESQAAKLGKAASPTEAGKAIQKGLVTFTNNFNQTVDNLYNKLDNYIKPADRVSVQSTLSKVNDIENRLPDAPNIAEAFTDPALSKPLQALKADAVDGQLSYQAVKKLRTIIGRKISNVNLDPDTYAELSTLYGALSDDMKNAAASKGEQALNTFNRANNYYAAGKSRIDNTLQTFMDKATPEKAYQAAISGTKLGATELTILKRSLPKDRFNNLSATILRKMGQTTDSAQNAAGDAFSINTFLTNYNKLRETRDVLFNKEQTTALNKLAQAAERFKKVSRYSNTSNTTGNVITGAGIGAAFFDPVSILTFMGSTYGAGKLITNPKLVETIAKYGAKPLNKNTAASFSKELQSIAFKNPEIGQPIYGYLNSLGISRTQKEEKKTMPFEQLSGESQYYDKNGRLKIRITP